MFVSYDFKDRSFTIDTHWKLGFVGRNERGKTTFLKLLMKKCEYSGTILSTVKFDYFLFELVENEKLKKDIKRFEKASKQTVD